MTQLVWMVTRMWSSKAPVLSRSAAPIFICFTQLLFFAAKNLDENLGNLAIEKFQFVNKTLAAKSFLRSNQYLQIIFE